MTRRTPLLALLATLALGACAVEIGDEADLADDAILQPGFRRNQLVLRDATSGLVEIWRPSADGSAIASRTPLLGGDANPLPPVVSNQQIVATGDFDGDQHGDLLWRNTTNGDVTIFFLQNATLDFVASVSPAFPLAWSVAGIGDFNGDDKSDVLWFNTATRELRIWLLNGATILPASGAVATLSATRSAVGVGDFDFDGKSDILVRDGTDIFTWKMNGIVETQFGPLATGWQTTWVALGTGDLTGEGRDDVVWRNATTGQLFLWAMSSISVRSPISAYQNTPLDWSFAGIGDFDADGRFDLLWRQSPANAPDVFVQWRMQTSSVRAAAVWTRPGGGAAPIRFQGLISNE